MYTAIAAFIAATIGSFLGAYFKEFLFDKFNKKRKQTEIRIALVKNLSVFYGILKRYVVNRNMLEYEQAMLDQTRAVKEKINWNNPNEVSSYEKNVSGRFEHVKFLATKHEDDFNQLIEIESDIKALVIEASHYFAIHNSKQLNKTIVEGFEADSLLATDYRSMSYQELERYYLN